MKTFILLVFLLVDILGTTTYAADLTTGIKLKKLRISADYAPKIFKRSYKCQTFNGSYDQTKLKFEVEAKGGEGKITHTLVYMFGNGYETKERRIEQHSVKKQGRKETFTVKIPKLKDSVPYVNQVLTLISRDSRGNIARASVNFSISRPVVLTPSIGEEAKKLNCYQRYTAYESVAGVLSNGSSAMSTLDIKQGIQRLWENRRGHNWGVYVTPQVQLGVFNLAMSLNYSYFKETSKQTVETTEVSSTYNLNPGDYLQIFTQPTRYVKAYDATMVTSCGDMKKNEASYMFQWWGYAYHVRPVDPFASDDSFDLNTVGGYPANTCSQEFTRSELDGNFVGFN